MCVVTYVVCHVKISNVIIHFASDFLLFDLPDQIRSAAGRAFCTVDLFVSLIGEKVSWSI